MIKIFDCSSGTFLQSVQVLVPIVALHAETKRRLAQYTNFCVTASC